MQTFLNICCKEQWDKGIFRRIEAEGDLLCLLIRSVEGYVVLPPVDSGEVGFSWSRVRLDAVIPEQGSIRVFARSSDNAEWPLWEKLEEGDGPELLWEAFGEPVAFDTDFWLTLTGRFLWLALELNGSGMERVVVNGISLLMEGDHMMDYLPSIYQGQDFTYRYLSIFTSFFQDMEEELECFPGQLDPESASPEMLRYMSSWLCLDPDGGESLEVLRERLPGMTDEYEGMYTPEGIRRSVERLTGKRPWLVEHFAVDPNDPSCSNPELYRKLYGDNPYRFFLLLPQGSFPQQKDMELFLEKMRELIPAETEFELIMLKPCVQLDWHTYLGINSRIGDYIPAVIDESVTIHYDTSIGGPEDTMPHL